jgi:hypothetical protein
MNEEIIHIKLSGRHLETRGWNTAHQKQNLKADINQVEPSRLLLAICGIGSSIQEAMPLTVDSGVMSHMGGKGLRG